MATTTPTTIISISTPISTLTHEPSQVEQAHYLTHVQRDLSFLQQQQKLKQPQQQQQLQQQQQKPQINKPKACLLQEVSKPAFIKQSGFHRYLSLTLSDPNKVKPKPKVVSGLQVNEIRTLECMRGTRCKKEA
ncbi:hypothetical protein HELRODRAFT_175164 [Helobdella robusta]|uniref:Uncharacterized protein n=1 Tax=Helobdella robusta TaxID=6412 RepID=T1F8Y0_HELRO|nr:hypothetical protein HELRODRAFT_175164 [Helobdella robusta]ESO01135.1 hypothetical protein HELRODRAFT_175164 [Helobdella robusta]